MHGRTIIVLLWVLASTSGCGDDGGGPDAASDSTSDAEVDGSAVADVDSGADTDMDESPPGTEYDGVLDFDGNERPYRVHVPGGMADDEPIPLVVSIHGLAADLVRQQLFSAFDEVANKYGFAVVYPTSHTNSWNAGACCQSSIADDVSFFRDLVAEVQGQLSIDPKRIYATGMSNGGYMSHRLACEASDLFASVAAVAGTLAIAADDCQPERAISVLTIEGTADELVGLLSFVWTDTSIPILSPQDSTAGWAERNNCSSGPSEPTPQEDWPTEPVSGTAVPGVALAGGAVGDVPQEPTTPGASCEYYTDCDEGVEVALCTHDGGHDWPTGSSTAIWAFFERHPMP